MDKELYSIKEATEQLRKWGIDIRWAWVDRAARAGKIAYVRFGNKRFIPYNELERIKREGVI